MKQKVLFSLFGLILFIMTASTSFAATYIVYNDGTGWKSADSNGVTTVLPQSTSCGYNSNMRYKNGTGTSLYYYYGQWANQNVPYNQDSSFQYQVYIPSCNSSASVSYILTYGYSFTQVSVNQNLYSNVWYSLGSYYIPGSSSQSSTIKIRTQDVSTNLVVGWDEAAYATN